MAPEAPDGWVAVRNGNDYFFWPKGQPLPSSITSPGEPCRLDGGYATLNDTSLSKYRIPQAWKDLKNGEGGKPKDFNSDNGLVYNANGARKADPEKIWNAGGPQQPSRQQAWDEYKKSHPLAYDRVAPAGPGLDHDIVPESFRSDFDKWYAGKYPSKREAVGGGIDYSTVDNDSVKRTAPLSLPECETKSLALAKPQFSAGGNLFEEMYAKWYPTGGNAAGNAGQGWRDLGIALDQMANKLAEYQEGRGPSELQKWDGAAKKAAMINLKASIPNLRTASKSASAMGSIVDFWNTTVKAVYDQIIPMYPEYQRQVDENIRMGNATEAQQAKEGYNSFAAKVMNDIYAENYDQICKKFPKLDVYGDATPPVPLIPPTVQQPPGQQPAGQQPQQQSPGGGGPNGAGGKTPDLSALQKQLKNLGQTPATATPTAATKQQEQNPASSALQGVGDAAKSATDATKGVADGLKDAAGQGVDAGKQALDALTGLTNKAGLPEGVLGLGPSGLGGALDKPAAGRIGGAGGGAHGGGGGSGGGLPKELSARPTGPTVEASKAAAAETQASRAGVSPGAGSGGSGAPAAGARGAGTDGKVHKVNKKLLQPQQAGEKLIVAESGDGVVPVLGAAEPESEKKPSRS
ncbi:hypothetical protein [Mycobacteroides chelonae]